MVGGAAARYRRRSDVLWRRCIDRVLVLAEGADSATVLTGTGVTLWELLDQPRALRDLAAELAGLYETTESEVSNDLGVVLDELSRRGILERVDP